MKSKLRP